MRRKVGEHCKDLLCTFLIEYGKIIKVINQDMKNFWFVPVATDESYIHYNHNNKYLYMKKIKVQVGRSNKKGQRRIIMHAITPKDPIGEWDNKTNLPVSNLLWKGDTCHPHLRKDGKLTCKMIWKSSSRSGDYHENMNSNMFMKWIEEKLIPTFERLHPGKTMVLVLDNATIPS
jgi:hypothetical protein